MTKQTTFIYCAGCMFQNILVCVIVSILRTINIEISYNTIPGLICIMLGGISSALWGIIVNVKYMHTPANRIFKDFFSVRQPIKYYILIAALMLIDFCPLFWGGKLVIAKWYIPIFIFLKSLVFGGIEEIGWRYTFHPAIRKREKFVISVLTTFILWALWHCLFFYIDGSLMQIKFFEFFFGLLTTSFILGMIFELTNSLWLCVFTHCFINTMSQIFSGGSELITWITRIALMTISYLLVLKRNKRHYEINYSDNI